MTPEIQEIPYREMIEILRATLKRAEDATALNPDDRGAEELAKSLRPPAATGQPGV